MDERTKYPPVPLGEVLVQDKNYVTQLEPRLYPKLSVKLYGRGAVLDTPADGGSVRMKRHQLARPGQVILSEIWAKKGAIGIVPHEGDGALITSHFFLFDIKENSLLPGFVKWLLRGDYFGRHLWTEARGTTGYAAIRPTQFLKLEIPLPPLAEQQRIVARIDALAARIEEAKGLRAEAMAEVEAVMGAASSQAIHSAESETVALEDICIEIIDCLHSNPRYSDDGIPTVRSPDVGWGTLDLEGARRTDEEEYVRRTRRGEPQEDDIIFVREGGGVGKAAIVLPGQRFSLGQRTMMLRLNPMMVVPKFFLFQLLSPLIYREQILERLKGSASPHLNIKALRKFEILMPHLDEQHRIVAYLDDLQAKVDAVKRLQVETQAELEALLPSVLDRAFSGGL
ncbi:MAG: hypothetical protein GY759_01645 [Chloroflexi bacterium]|nr:hypothetical protein [Chloroflexota bacterium]